ncbi:MAG: ABC transporter permease, partial [Micromonosporaceae bacterium]
PLIALLYGTGPRERFWDGLDSRGFPLGRAGGVSSEHWLGLMPGDSFDLMMQMIYGLRTSLFIATASALLTIVIGVVVGIAAGYLGGWVDAAISWLIDFTLAMPFLIFCLAAIPVAIARFFGPRDEVPPSFRVFLLIAVFGLFSWTYTARLVRGQVLSLREREFVEAARAAGAGTGHILFRQLLPNLWAPVLVTLSLNLPAFITAEAALSFLKIGVAFPTPSLGWLIRRSIDYLRGDPWYAIFPGVTIFLLVLAFNLFGDSLRDSLDPKSSR